MSLWTPGGEHEVPRESTGSETTEPAGGSEFDEEKLAAALGIPSLDELTDEEREQLEAALMSMAETERELASTPAHLVIANHLMGMYELAAIHLRQEPPNLSEATLAIDALGAVLDRLHGRLGENEPTLAEARTQIQQAFVAVGAAVDGAEAAASADGDGATDSRE